MPLHINRPMVDYLRLVHFSPTTVKEWDTLFAWVDAAAETARFLQYRGMRAGGLFYGDARQKGKRHHLLDISGSLAHELWERASRRPAKCTRIDLQVTLPLPAGYDARDLVDDLRTGEWPDARRQRSATLVEGGDGFDTVYIGSRQSERFLRLYVKPDGDGRKYLRFEVEYKGQPAVSVWADLQRDRATIAKALAAEAVLLPDDGFYIKEAVRGVAGAFGTPPPVKRRKSTNSTLSWLVRQVAPAIRRAMRDHDIGRQVRAIVLEWAQEAKAIDATGR